MSKLDFSLLNRSLTIFFPDNRAAVAEEVHRVPRYVGLFPAVAHAVELLQSILIRRLNFPQKFRKFRYFSVSPLSRGGGRSTARRRSGSPGAAPISGRASTRRTTRNCRSTRSRSSVDINTLQPAIPHLKSTDRGCKVLGTNAHMTSTKFWDCWTPFVRIWY